MADRHGREWAVTWFNRDIPFYPHLQGWTRLGMDLKIRRDQACGYCCSFKVEEGKRPFCLLDVQEARSCSAWGESEEPWWWSCLPSTVKDERWRAGWSPTALAAFRFSHLQGGFSKLSWLNILLAAASSAESISLNIKLNFTNSNPWKISAQGPTFFFYKYKYRYKY